MYNWVENKFDGFLSSKVSQKNDKEPFFVTFILPFALNDKNVNFVDAKKSSKNVKTSQRNKDFIIGLIPPGQFPETPKSLLYSATV